MIESTQMLGIVKTEDFMKYNFYYDETEHSRAISYNTISADNYYDNFITVIVGWRSNNTDNISKRYLAFEEKYACRKTKGELKSLTLKQKQFEHGFASLNSDNVKFLDNYFSLYDDTIFLYFAITSKIEFIIRQLFDGYTNSVVFDMDALKYSITKAIVMYQPENVLAAIYKSADEFLEALIQFFNNCIEQNRRNGTLKEHETAAFEQILFILNDIADIKEINWDYTFSFDGFKKYLYEKNITDYELTIDKEGNGKTTSAAVAVGIINVNDDDSCNQVGLRMADMFAGVLAKLLKALHNELKYKSFSDGINKKILSKEWFILTPEKLQLYKKLRYIVSQLNDAWYKSYSGIYADDVLLLVSLLNYFSEFESVEKIDNINMRGEYFNTYVIATMQEYYKLRRNKLPIDIMPPSKEDTFVNQRGARVFFDTMKNPLLPIKNGKNTYEVLSVGLSKEWIPLVTIQKGANAYCYRLPEEYSEWAFTVVGLANFGTNMFPARVTFSLFNGKYMVDIE